MHIIKKLINQTFKTPGIYFSAIIINKNTLNFEKDFGNDPYKAYEKFTEQLLLNTIRKNEILFILADYVSTPKFIRFEVDIKHNINQSLKRLAIGGIHRVDSKGLNLIQITDLFLCCVVYNYKIQNKLVTGDRNKIKIMNLILNKLKRKTFIGGIKTRRFWKVEYNDKNKNGPSS